jgi:hypothetical protein
MNGETQGELENRSRGAVWAWFAWLGGILFLYFLRTGPVVMMEGRKIIREGSPTERFCIIVHAPVRWAQDETLLSKPLGLYWHLWAPNLFNSHGDPR